MIVLRARAGAIFTLFVLFLGGCEQPDLSKEAPQAAPADKPTEPTKTIPAEAKKVQDAFLPGTYTMHTAYVKAIDRKAIALSKEGPNQQVIYPFHPVMANGGVQKNTREKYAYRIGDVRVGDQVEVGIWWRDGDPYSVVEICILKRPGGKVPESPYPNPYDQKPTYAMMQNAKNDFEDRGIPYPPGFQKPGTAELLQEKARFLKEHGLPPPPGLQPAGLPPLPSEKPRK